MPFIQDYETAIGGQLGKKTGARYRVYMRLDDYYKDNKDTLFDNDKLKRTIEDIYKFPLKETAKEIFNRQLKSGISDMDLALLAISINEEDNLCIINQDGENKIKDPKIICSMGLKNV